MIRATARRRQGFHHEVQVGGHVVVSDEPTESGGSDAGPSPTRLLAASLASCTAITVEMYAQRKGWELPGFEVTVDFAGTPEGGDPAHFMVNLGLPAELSAEQVGRIRTIAAKCPVHRTLTGQVEVEVETSGPGD